MCSSTLSVNCEYVEKWAHTVRPYGKNAPGALVRQSQAQKWNRAHSNFPQTQGPVARREFRPATQILRAGNALPAPRGNPRNGVRGKATMSTKCSSGAVPGDPLVSF